MNMSDERIQWLEQQRRAEELSYKSGYSDGYHAAMREILGEEEYNKWKKKLNQDKDEWFNKRSTDIEGDGIGEW